MPGPTVDLPPESAEVIEAALAQPWYRFGFGSHLEPRFERTTAATRAVQIRFALCLIASVHLFLLLFDMQAGIHSFAAGARIRLLIQLPLYLLAAGLIGRARSAAGQAWMVAVPLLIGVAGDGWLGLSYAGPPADRYFMGYAVSFFLYNLLIPQRLRHAILTTLGCLAIYDVMLSGWLRPCPIEHPGPLILDMNLFVIFSLGSRWKAEVQFRENFLLGARDRVHVRELAWANRHLTELSYTDALTGLPNRRFFDEVFARVWEQACASGAPVSLLMIDVDRFKSFNDMLGHPAGDHCLRVIARPMQFSIKVSRDTLARYGGEEFIAILPGASASESVAVANRIRNAIAALQIEHPRKPDSVLTVSIGVASIASVTDDDSAEELLHAADRALYVAKSQGRNCVAAEPTLMAIV
jgi:diguanylate cyclase (GGDEF)-like protein